MLAGAPCPSPRALSTKRPAQPILRRAPLCVAYGRAMPTPEVEDADTARYMDEALTGLSQSGHARFFEIHAVKR
jgi:hypothetical protein